MRNLRLLATVLFVAVLLVGIVLLLRQTNVPNDTSVTSTDQVTNQQLAVNTTAQTDPPIRVKKAKGARIANGVQPIRTQLENSKGASATTSANQAELTPIDGLSIVPGNVPTATTKSANSVSNVRTGQSKLRKVRALQQNSNQPNNK